MTGFVQSDFQLMIKNAKKVLTVARTAKVSSVLLTGKGEPMLNVGDTMRMIEDFNEYPLEIQTNGLVLSKDYTLIELLAEVGVNTISISIDNMETFKSFRNLYSKILACRMSVRICFNVTTDVDWGKEQSLKKIIAMCQRVGIRQLLIRSLTIPNRAVDTPESKKAQKWIKAFGYPYNKVDEQFKKIKKNLIRVLNHGAGIYDVNGIAVSFSDYCIQEVNNTEDIRSLIFLEDGHLYTSWNSKASLLF